MKRMTIPNEYAIVLQHINDSMEEDFEYLAESLRFNTEKLAHIIQELHHKGLIISRPSSYGLWIRLSAKGKKAIRNLWPEATAAPMAA